MESFHGTTAQCVESILSNNFKFDDFIKMNRNNKMICDLGCGVYTFCEDEYGISSPDKMAREYAEKYRNQFTKDKPCGVIKVSIKDTDDILVLNFDDPNNNKRLRKARQNLQQRIDNIYIKVKNNGAKRRANLDGILIELAVNKNIFENPDILYKETYTSLGEVNDISSFPNGRELVIRNLNVIDGKVKVQS